jgi:hypothetical protein
MAGEGALHLLQQPGAGELDGGEIDCHAPVVMTRARQALIWRHASSMTQLPMGMMSRLFSASGRKLAGETAPCSGCCQRSRASAPTTWPLRAQYLGW